MKSRTSVGWVAMAFALGVLAITLSAGLFYVGNKHKASRIEAEKARQERTAVITRDIAGTDSADIGNTNKDKAAGTAINMPD